MIPKSYWDVVWDDYHRWYNRQVNKARCPECGIKLTVPDWEMCKVKIMELVNAVARGV